ncbi:MAG: DUF1533 domain-containing protein [Eubacteriales bacterium]|nr:DUF1533 domain-containing protein [Eubacteriales bacterium]
MRKRNIQTKALTAAVAASMVVGLCPATVFAATGSEIAADGIYKSTAHVVNDPENEEDWIEYDVTVSLDVENGKFSEINVTTSKEYTEGNNSYFQKAVSKSKGIQTKLEGQDATEAVIQGWDTVSGATCTSKAIKEAALDAIHKAPEASDVTVDTKELEEAIQNAEALTEGEYTAESWKILQEKLTAAKAALEAKESQEKVAAAAKELNEAVSALEKTAAEEIEYVLMNIPYAEFYKADVQNDVPVDAFSSATKSKTRTGSLAGGSYHVNSDGSDITGITFPVKVGEGVDLSSYTQITDENSVEITVTNRGQTNTTVYEGKDALFESASYSYYVLSEAPEYYKEVTANADGSLSFGKTQGEIRTLEDVEGELLTESSYGDYELDLTGLGDAITTDDQIYGVIVSTKEGSDYGLRHLENIWRVSYLAWSTGFTKSVHNCPTSSAHYEAMMGQTINKVTYYTSKGIYEIPLADEIYVPVKFEGGVEVADASVAAGSTAVTVTGLPEDYDAQYSVRGLKAGVADGVMTYTNAEKGKYTLVISDKNGKYADLSADFILYAETMPAEYNEDSSAPALVKAKDATEEEFADYLQNITSVSVNGRSYAASGRGAVVIVNEDGTIKTDAEPIAKTGEYNITISSTGYKDVSFTYVVEAEAVYVLMNIPYAEFYQADVQNDVPVDAFSSATKSKTRTGSLAGGSYHVNSDGSDITGITFPVKVGEGVDLSSYTQITDENSVEITVTNRGQTNTTVYEGKDALFESASYSYYVLSEAPEYYKEVTANADGSLSFGKTQGEIRTLEDVEGELLTESSYGDYELDLTGLGDAITTDDQIYGVIVSTKEGSDYGLRHLENIWRVSYLAWSTGFTKSVHNCPTSSAHYEAMMGQTINKVTYYTSKGIYEIPLADEIYVPVKFEGGVEVADASVAAGSTAVTVTGLPEDYDAQYSVRGLKAGVADGVMTYTNAEKGKYTLVISDKNGKYADLSADFILYAETMPAEYNEDSSAPALVKAKDATEEEFADYLQNITSVSVNGRSYAASGRGAVVIIKEDGTIDIGTAPFAEGDSFEIVVSSTGYQALTFKYTKAGEPVVDVNTSSLEKAIAEAEKLKEADYTAESWKALQTALADAKNALEAKESQEAVDNAANALNSAIEGLKKNTSDDPGTTGGTNSSSGNKTTKGNSSQNKGVKTGDPANVMGLLGLAAASLGAGGFTFNRRRKSKR